MLMDPETHYAQIEKELLAVGYGLEKFHTYTYGRQVTVESDHKPLERIVKKPLQQAPEAPAHASENSNLLHQPWLYEGVQNIPS